MSQKDLAMVAPKESNGKTPETAPAAPEIKAAKPAPETKAQVTPSAELDPITKRIQRFEELERLKERRDQVTDALEDLEEFHVGQAGSANLQLTDSRNRSFRISHPIVIADMVASAKEKLKAELAKIDAQFIV